MKTERKKKHGINFIDVAIVVIVIAVLAAGFYFINHMSSTRGAGENVQISYRLEIDDVPEEISTAPMVGDVLIDSGSKSELGTIVAVERQPMTKQITDYESKEMRTAEVPGKFKVILTCESPALSTEEKITVNSCRIATGSGIDFRSKHFSGHGICISSKILEDVKGGLIND